jgi:hypothetical protein
MGARPTDWRPDGTWVRRWDCGRLTNSCIVTQLGGRTMSFVHHSEMQPNWMEPHPPNSLTEILQLR